MSRSSSSADRARRRAAPWLALLCLTASCSREMEIGMRQPIAMGPWTFEVERADDRTESLGGQQLKIVSVDLALHNYEERHEKPFDDFLNGRSRGSMMFPHLVLRDAGGTTFDGLLVPLSGGSLRSRGWRADFVLVPSSVDDMAGGGPASLASRYLETRLADLRLVLDNPDRRGDQPGRVVVPLR